MARRLHPIRAMHGMYEWLHSFMNATHAIAHSLTCSHLTCLPVIRKSHNRLYCRIFFLLLLYLQIFKQTDQSTLGALIPTSDPLVTRFKAVKCWTFSSLQYMATAGLPKGQQHATKSRAVEIDPYIQTYILTYTYTYLHTYLHTYRQTYVHTYIYTGL
jgi:hypothetical protein